MQTLPDQTDITDVPPHVQAWSAARIPGFVPAVLKRWQREHGALPKQFHLTLCPQAEVNARGGLPAQVHELTNPRLTCRHFTGCHKPYVIILHLNDDAADHQRAVLAELAWSEGYQVEVTPTRLCMQFVGCTEDLGDDPSANAGRTRLQELLENGDLIRILE